MHKLIKIFTALLISFWIWGVDWSQRNIDTEVTKFLISNQFALALRFIFLLTIIFFIFFKFKNHIFQYIFIAYSGIIAIIVFIFNPIDEIFTILNFLISASVFSLLTNNNLEFLEKISFKTTQILLLGGLLYLFIFEYSSLTNVQNQNSVVATLVPNLSGFTTVNYKRFFGFFGGPIVLSSVSAITFIKVIKLKFKSIYYKFINLAICTISISLSNSIAGLIFLGLYYGIDLSLNLLNNISIRLPKLTLKNISIYFIVIFTVFIFYLTQSQALDLFIGKISFVFLIISGNNSIASELLNNDQFIRSSGSFMGRILDINYILSSMNLSSYLVGSLFDVDRNKFLSESGLISLISIYGIPLTILFLYLSLKNFGLKIFMCLLLFNIPYNIFLMHPVYLLAPIFLRKNKI